jgi:hypothetical protein
MLRIDRYDRIRSAQEREENILSIKKKLRVYKVQASPCGYEGKYCFRDMAWAGGGGWGESGER